MHVLQEALDIARPSVHTSTGHASCALECQRGGGAVEQLTGLRTDESPPHGPRARRVIKRLGEPPTSCSQVQPRRTHAHRSIYKISSDILWRRAIYELQTGRDTKLQYTRNSEDQLVSRPTMWRTTYQLFQYNPAIASLIRLDL